MTAGRRRPPGSQANGTGGKPKGAPRSTGGLGLTNLRVRNRLVLLVLVPLIATLVLAATRIVTAFDDTQIYERVHYLASISQPVTQLISALEDERDYTAAYVANGRSASGLQAVNQSRSLTTKRVDAFQPAVDSVSHNGSYDAAVRNAFAVAGARLNDLPNVRQAVTVHAPATQTFSAYSDMISDLTTVVQEINDGTSDLSLANQVNTLVLLSQIEENTSLERGYLVDVLDARQFASGEYGDLLLAQSQLNGASDSLESTATPSIANMYQTAVGGVDVSNADSSLNSVVNAGAYNLPLTSLNLDGEIAFRQMSAKLVAIQNVEAAAARQAIGRASQMLSGSETTLYLNIGVVIVILLLTLLLTVIIARSLVGPLGVLRSSALDIAGKRLPDVVRRLRNPEAVGGDLEVEPIDIASQDEVGQVARAFDEVHREAVRLATEQALLRSNVNAMFVNLSRRSQGLVQRQLRLIDELENSEQDPDQLANLFKLDHLATRMRRNGENLLVLAGEEPGRRWSQPVMLLDVLRAAASEVEQYERVVLRDLPNLNVVGRVVNDLVHLVAELLENATSYSAPETKVTITANPLDTGGVMLEIEDSGIGMTPEELDDANERLANPPVVDVAISRRMGLFVVGRLATRHGIQVRLRRSTAGGVTALVLVPAVLVESMDRPSRQQSQNPAHGAPQSNELPRRMAGDVRAALDVNMPPSTQPAAGGWQGNEANAPATPVGELTGTFSVLPEGERQPPPQPRQERPAHGSGSYPTMPRGQNPGMPAQRAGERTGNWQQSAPNGGQPSVQLPRQAGPATGEYTHHNDPSGTGQHALPAQQPAQEDPASSGEFSVDPNAAGQFGRIDRLAQTGRLPRITDQTPPPQDGPPDQQAPPAPREQDENRSALPELRQPTLPAPTQQPQTTQQQGQSASLMPAQAPTPPAPVPSGFDLPPMNRSPETDERLPIFEAIESEWFRRRSAAIRSRQPSTSQSGSSQTDSSASSGTDSRRSAGMLPPRSEQPASTPKGDEEEVTAGITAETQPPASEKATPMEHSAEDQPAAGDAPEWQSPGDEGWKAAESVAKPVAAGLTPKGLPKRVPRTNLVPGSAGNNKPKPTVIPPRSAEAVRGRLSSFHQGLRQGRSAKQDDMRFDEDGGDS